MSGASMKRRTTRTDAIWTSPLIDREVESCGTARCSMSEDFAVNLSRGYLQSRTSDGIRLRLSGKGAKAVGEVPPALIAGFLSVVPEG